MNEPNQPGLGAWETLATKPTRRRWMGHDIIACALVAEVVGDALLLLLVLRTTFTFSYGGGVAAITSSLVPWLYAGCGTAIFAGAFAYNGIYTRELLLNSRKQNMFLFEAWMGACLVFFGATAILGDTLFSLFNPFAWSVLLLLALLGWRLLLQRALRCESVTQKLRQRIVVLGWSEGTAQLARQTWEAFVYPCEIIGYVEVAMESGGSAALPTVPCLGTKEDLAAVLNQYQIDVAFLAGINIAPDEMLDLARRCQTEMVEFKVIPSCFPALASGMHVEWVAGVPILGTDRLRINRLHVRMEKRVLDIVGAVVGLLLAGPLIGLFALLVYIESPGPVFYRQRRLGLKGKPFDMIKIRSMRLDAEKSGKAGWTVQDDPRRLRVGACMRRWNVDELPQFWNVLKGDMSLVGPRPERPEFIDNLKHEITHYNLRHFVKPGLTGWAQVNGLRGNTDLAERIRHDLFYIENWSVLLDVQTMFMTLYKHKNAC